VSRDSIAGYVAADGKVLNIPDAYSLPSHGPYRFNPEFDTVASYKSRSMLVLPMRHNDGPVVGVIQLINRKRHRHAVLTPATVDREVVPFTPDDEDLLASFASQAAVTLQNKRLLESIQRLFAGFVEAVVSAIDARDPATAGHSIRVARMTRSLAEAHNAMREREGQPILFPPDKLMEIEYAALLHDVGKIGVREHILVKAKKLYDWQLETIHSRFLAARSRVSQCYAELRLSALRTLSRCA
jgi:hypothetical protein